MFMQVTKLFDAMEYWYFRAMNVWSTRTVVLIGHNGFEAMHDFVCNFLGFNVTSFDVSFSQDSTSSHVHLYITGSHVPLCTMLWAEKLKSHTSERNLESYSKVERWRAPKKFSSNLLSNSLYQWSTRATEKITYHWLMFFCEKLETDPSKSFSP